MFLLAVRVAPHPGGEYFYYSINSKHVMKGTRLHVILRKGDAHRPGWSVPGSAGDRREGDTKRKTLREIAMNSIY